MTDAAFSPLRTLSPVAASMQTSDRFAELLKCMADLLVETRRQRTEIAQMLGSDDPGVREALARLAGLERFVEELGVEAVSIHKQIQHLHFDLN